MLKDSQSDDGSFLVLLGIDGSGKSTLLSELRTAGVATVSWHDLRSHEVPAMLAPDAPTSIKARLTPQARAMFVGGHLVAQYEYLVRPSIESGTTTLLDSYYYKLLAKERLLGFAHPSLEMLCAELPQPDHVIYISVDPEESLRRKRGVISPYEHFPSTGPSSYVEFQRALGAAMLASLEHIPHVVLDGSLARAELTKLAMISIRELSGQELA